MDWESLFAPAPENRGMYDALKAAMSVAPPGGPVTGYLWKALPGLAETTANIVATPGRVMQTAAVGDMQPNPNATEADFWRANQQKDALVNRAADVAGFATMGTTFAPPVKNAVGMGIRAYHGSPHDFEKFDLSKIGTGEGAQAYGHGLYFAEHEPVAKGYRDTLSQDVMVTPKGTVFDPMTLEHMNVRSRAHSNGPNIDATIGLAQRLANSDSPVADMAKRDLARLQELKAEGGLNRTKGRMYEVNINAEPHQFLDWDKPLSEQPQAVQSIGRDLIDNNGPWSGYVADADKFPVAGQSIYQALSAKELGATNAAAKLKEAGIPGIKYLDQGSRDVGQGTHNYVVFDDSLIEILKKYGIVGVPAGAALAATGTNDAYAK